MFSLNVPFKVSELHRENDLAVCNMQGRRIIAAGSGGLTTSREEPILKKLFTDVWLFFMKTFFFDRITILPSEDKFIPMFDRLRAFHQEFMEQFKDKPEKIGINNNNLINYVANDVN